MPVNYPGTLGLVAAVTTLSVAALIPELRESITLIPANTMLSHFYVWNLLTGSLVEVYIPKLLINLIALGYCGSRLEQTWGLLGLAYFVVVVALVVSVLSSAFVFFLFVLARVEEVLFIEMCGSGGLVAALTTGMRLYFADESLPFMPSIQHKHVPLLYVAVNLVLGLFTGFRDMPLVILGLVIGWIYLRFYHKNADGTVGDTSEEFSFTALFPKQLQPVIRPIAEFSFKFFALCGCFKDRRGGSLPTTNNAGRHSGNDFLAAAVAAVDPVAERRRARAMKLLDAKLESMAAQELPSLTAAGPTGTDVAESGVNEA